MRQRLGITEFHLADVLPCLDGTVLSFERCQRRVPVSVLPTLSKALGVSVEELLSAPEGQPAKRGPAPKLQRQLEQLSQLPRSQQRFVSQMLDTVLQQAER